MNKNLCLEDIISDTQKELIKCSLLSHLQLNSFKKPSFILNSLQYTKGICQNPKCLSNEVVKKELILSHAISANWVFISKDNNYNPLYTLYINYEKFPDNNFEEPDILSIFYKNSDIETKDWGDFSEYQKEFINKYHQYAPLKFHSNIFENSYKQALNCFQFYIFSNYKKYCAKCDEKIFDPIDDAKKIDTDFFLNLIKNNETRKLVLERFKDYFNYRNDNKKYILNENMKNITEEENEHPKITPEYFSKKQIEKLNELKKTLSINVKQKKTRIHSCMSIIFSNLDLHQNLENYFLNSDLGLKNCCTFIINIINDILSNSTDSLIIPYNKSMTKMENIRTVYKNSYIAILNNHHKNNDDYLKKDLSEIDVIYYEKEKKADFFGFSYFTLNNIIQFINENIPESHKITIDINKNDGGYCFLTPMKDEKINSFYVFSDNNVKEKIDSVIESINSLLQNKYKKEELLSLFYYSTFLWESENLCIYSKEKKHLEEIKKFLKIIKSQDENKIENLIKFFRETSINK